MQTTCVASYSHVAVAVAVAGLKCHPHGCQQEKKLDESWNEDKGNYANAEVKYQYEEWKEFDPLDGKQKDVLNPYGIDFPRVSSSESFK